MAARTAWAPRDITERGAVIFSMTAPYTILSSKFFKSTPKIRLFSRTLLASSALTS